MFTTAHRGINAYATVGIETGVDGADPHALILMLYDGALLALADARYQMAQKNIAAKGQSISKAIMIIESGLKISLDIKAGGKLGERLAALYDYMCDRLLRANLQNKVEIIEEVSGLLTELRGAWAQIKPEAGVGTGDGTANIRA
jgi:flagellar protein FliS